MNPNNLSITIRKATLDDIADLVRLRRMMFESMGCVDEAKLNASDRACAEYFANTLATGDYHGWLAVTESGWPVATGGLVVDYHPPSPDNLSGRVAYIMNMVTDPAYRHQGLARRIMQAMLSWINEQGITVVSLHASPEGEPLYRLLGFKPGNEMRLYLA